MKTEQCEISEGTNDFYFPFSTAPERASSKETETDDDELRLLSYLFKEKYNKEVRPVNNKSHPVEVTIDLAYTQLIDLVCFVFAFFCFSK